MTTKIGLFKFVVLLSLAAVNGFGLIIFKNMNEHQLVEKLANILNEPDDDSVEVENHIAVRSSRKDLHDAHQKFERKKLIKTYLPHGHEVNFETEGEAIYKTLVRIHKKKTPMFIKDHDEYKIKFDSIGRSGYPLNNDASDKEKEHKRYKKLNKNNLSEETARIWNKLKALKYMEKKSDDKEKHLRTFNEFFNKTKITNSVSQLWKKFRNALPFKKSNMKENIQKEKSMLRKLSKFFNSEDVKNMRSGRSGEEHDPLAPGRVPFNLELHEDTTPQASLWQPQYSFWNYWTYDKSLYQDHCRGGLVKVGNRCIGSPPH